MSLRPRVLTRFVRTHLEVFAEHHASRREAVRASAGPEAWKTVEEATSLGWLDLEVHIRLTEAIAAEVGPAAAAAVCRATMLRSFEQPFLKPLFQGALNILGRRLDRFARWTPKAWPALYRDAGELRWVPGEDAPHALVLAHAPPALRESLPYVEGIAACFEGFYDVLEDSGRVAALAGANEITFRFVAR